MKPARPPPTIATPGSPFERIPVILHDFLRQLVEISRLVDDGLLRPAIDSVFPLAEAPAAFERSLARGKRGKVVLRVADARTSP